MGAFEDFVNRELPRRSAALTFAITGYDGDPNATSPSPPAIITSAPTGTWFLWQSRNQYFRKNRDGIWIGEDPGIFSRPVIYVDPAGDNDNDGSISSPVASLFEATQRVALFGVNMVWLQDGTHPAEDIYTKEGLDLLTLERCTFFSHKGVTVKGVNTTTAATVNITSWGTGATTNVATVSDTLVTNALVGLPFLVSPFGAGIGFDVAWYVIANTTNTITVGASATALGGWLPDPSGVIGTGSKTLEVPSAKIVTSATNGNFFTNRVLYDGIVNFENIDFDGTVNASAFGPTARTMGAVVFFLKCRFLGWPNYAIDHFGRGEVSACYFDGQGAGSAGGIRHGGGYLNVSNDCVFQDLAAGIQARDGATLVFPSGGMQWSLGNFLYFFVEGARVYDFATRFYAAAGAYGTQSFMRFDGQDSYSKQNVPWVQLGTHGLAHAFSTSVGGNSVDLFDSANAGMASGDYIRVDGVGATLAQYNAGSGSAIVTGVRRAGDATKGIFFYD